MRKSFSGIWLPNNNHFNYILILNSSWVGYMNNHIAPFKLISDSSTKYEKMSQKNTFFMKVTFVVRNAQRTV